MRVSVPGDKSLSQRALILAALADGESHLSGLLYGGDSESTAQALRYLGVDIPVLPEDGSEIRIEGVGLRGLRTPDGLLDLGNSGTGARLLTGVLCGSSLTATLDGDASLQGRPMGRVIKPLTAMGASITYVGQQGRLPVRIEGRGSLEPVDWPGEVASAQVKSAVLLAGLVGQAFVLFTEPRKSRDHTERLFNEVGVSVLSHAAAGGWRVEMRDPPERIEPLDLRIPGDLSSAAFLLAIGALGAAGPELTVAGVGLNPTRTAFLDVLRRMGAELSIETSATPGPEPAGDITIRGAELRGVTVDEDEVPALIDELPMIAALGAVSTGVTRITGAAELRHKESDRISAMVANIRAIGGDAQELPDGLVVQGTAEPLKGRVRTFSDHRIAMAFCALGSVDRNEIEVEDLGLADLSFPGFHETVTRITGSV
jgi:3-phosphoshikimate 1-carboxyvinyltransferase